MVELVKRRKMDTISLTIPNISCGHCIHTIKMELMEMEGVTEVTTDLAAKQVNVVFSAPANEEAIKNLLKEINYPAA
jgi:copper chaperone CopZ